MVILMILIIGTATGYDLQCPAKSEWRLRANVSCYSEDKYVCLFHELENRYEDNCLGSDQSSIGSKLVFQPLFNIADCNTGRFQPIVFTTNGNSECILLKSKCDEEGQVVFSNGSTSNDIACHCDYTKGYAFVSTPKNSCFCIPSEEDCSCIRVKCPKLSPDYQCLTERKMIKNTKCQEIQPHLPEKQHNRTVQYIENNILDKRSAHQVTYIIIVIIAVYIVIAVSTILVIPTILPQESMIYDTQESIINDDEKQKFIHELLLKGECGKHHFARVVFIGENGVGKTSLMRRLLWQNKEQVTSTESTDGIEIEKCNINVKTGMWSPCDKIDDDLTRLIDQVYTEKKTHLYQESGRNNETHGFDREHSSNTTNNSEIEFDGEIALQETMTFTNHVEESSETRYNESDDKEKTVDGCYADANKNNSEISGKVQRENEHIIISEIADNVSTEESTSNTIEAESLNLGFLDISQIKSNDIEILSGSDNDENVQQMTSAIMESCIQRKEGGTHDMKAFCWLWDFAGQRDFYATHQVFLSTCAIYLLVTDRLEFSTAEKLWTDFENSAQYVRFWFDTIHCYWSTTTSNRLDPPIIVVCTNEDKFKIKKERQKRQDDFQESLGRALNSQKKKDHLRNIYFISNTEDDDDVFEEIRTDISRQAMHMNDWGRDCPLKWLLFQQVLGKLKDSNVSISSTTKLLKIANHDEIGIQDYEEFKLCLQFYHDIGTIIYFDEENLKDYVILDPKWLVDSFRCLVSDKIAKFIKVSDDWKKLKETGELTESLISELFTKEPKLKFSENKAHLIEVMKRFDIIVNLKNSTALYMPCMTESCSFADVRKQFMDENNYFSRTSWLCLEFEFLPPAFFNHILAWYIKQYSVSIILEKGSRKERKAIYRQIGVFNLDSSGCEQLVICEGPNVIALQVWDSQNSNEKTYGYLAAALFIFVNTLRNRYRLKIEYTKSFKCKDGDFTINRETIRVLDFKHYRCLEHKGDHLSNELVQPWDLGEELEQIRLQHRKKYLKRTRPEDRKKHLKGTRLEERTRPEDRKKYLKGTRLEERMKLEERKKYLKRIKHQERLGRSISMEALYGDYAEK